jgi:ATP-binding cassette subfamily B protein
MRLEWPSYGVGLLSLLVVNACDVAAPLALGLAVDHLQWKFVGEAPSSPWLVSVLGLDATRVTMLGTVLVWLGLQFAANGLRYPMLMYVGVPSHRLGQRVRNAIVAHLLALRRPWHDRARSGEVMSLGTSDVGAVRMMLGPGILVGMDTVFLFVLVLLVMWGLSPRLALLSLVPLPFIVLATQRLTAAEYRRFEEVQADIGRLTEQTRESIAAMRIVQGYAREPHDLERFRLASERHLGLQVRLARVRSLLMPTLELLPGVATVVVLVGGGLEVVGGRMSLGTLTSFLFLVGYLSGPMMGLGWSLTLFQRGRASLARIRAFLAQPDVMPEAPSGSPALAEQPALEVSHLSFRYEGPPPLDGAAPAEPNALPFGVQGLTFTLTPGRTVGIVGPVGSGKSTLLHLLVRLYEVPRGTVRLGGVDVRDLPVDTLRRHVVLAPQEAFLFSDTVGRNILLGAPSGQDDPWPAAGKAAVADELRALPEGMDTLLGERGVTLSGGQRQRVSLARALAARPSILLLDDALSAVDARTEASILGNLRDAVRQGGGIIVSHRVVAVRECDEILVLEAGRIVDRGTHEELCARPGFYAAMVQDQMRDGEAAS